MAKKQKILYIKVTLLITAIAFVIYAKSFGNQFVWDDKRMVVENSFIKSWNYLPKLFTTELYHFVPTTQSNYYRPLQTLSYMFDYSLWQLNVPGYHLTNLIFHILNATFIFSLVNLISKDRRLSLAVSLLFIVHPIHTESVSYISGRADLLVGFFLLLSFILFIKYSHYPPPKRSFCYVGSVISFILALLSKEIAIVFPILLLVYDRCFPAQVASLRFAKRIKERYLTFFIVDISYILLRITLLNFTGQLITPRATNLYLRLLTMCKSIVIYIGLLFMPLNLHIERKLSPAGSFFEPQVLACVLLVVIGVGVIWIYRSRKMVIYFGLLWFIVTLFPQSSLIFPKTMAEHFLYLPSVGIFLILAMLSKWLMGRRLSVARPMLISFLVFYAVLTWGQNINWKDPVTFYRWTLRYAPNSFKVHNNLGLVYEAKGLYDQAIYEYKRALEINPDYMHAHNNLGNVYTKMGLFDVAIKEYQEALKIKSNILLVMDNLLNVYEIVIEEALRNNPHALLTNDNLMVICNKAIDEYRKRLQSGSDSDILHYNLGVLYRRKGLIQEALSEYEQALKINPNHISAHSNLGSLYEEEGFLDKAMAEFEKVVSIDPQFSRGYYNMGVIYGNEGRWDQAIELWKKALEIDPNYEQARLNIKKAEEIKRLEEVNR